MCVLELSVLLLSSLKNSSLDLLTCMQSSPPMLACQRANVDMRARMDTLRLFLHNVDFSDHDLVSETSEGCHVLRPLAHDKSEGVSKVLTWLLQMFSSDIRQNFSHFEFAVLLLELEEHDPQSTLAEILLDKFDTRLAATSTLRGLSVLHWVLTSPNASSSLLQKLINRGANIQCVGHSLWSQDAGPQTPTSMAIRNSRRFSIWRKSLTGLNYDIRKLIQLELNQCGEMRPLNAAGWTEDTLLNLFNLEFEPVVLEEEIIRCDRCNTSYGYLKEPWWERALNSIRNGQTTDLKHDSAALDDEQEEPRRSFCPPCSNKTEEKSRKQNEASEYEDSPFLLSIDNVLNRP